MEERVKSLELMKRIQDLETQQKQERLASQQEAEKQKDQLQSLMNRFENMMEDSTKKPTTKRGIQNEEASSKNKQQDMETDESSSDDAEETQYITTPDGQKVTWFFWGQPLFYVS